MMTAISVLVVGWLLVECGYYLGWTQMRAKMCKMLDHLESKGSLDVDAVLDYIRNNPK